MAFAGSVFVYHAFVLAWAEPGSHAETLLSHAAETAIQGFFIVSGLLVFGSLERSRSIGVYASKRFRRLYPAYAVIIIIPAVVSLAVTSGEDLAGVVRYLGANLVFANFLAPTLPGLFEGNRLDAVNGALWTLKIEVMFYLALPVIALVMRWSGKAWWLLLALIYVAAEAWRLMLPVHLDHPLAPELARQLPGQMAFFASGMALWKLNDLARSKAAVFLLAGAALSALSFAHPLLESLRPAGLAGLVAGLSYAPGPAIPAARFGDISYGLYITHFPILQGMVMAGLFASLSFAGAFALSVALVTAASLVLWHLVERPALRRDSHYRLAETGEPRQTSETTGH